MKCGLCALAAAVLVQAGCVRYRMVRVESAVPAGVREVRFGGVDCPATPCRVKVSRNWPFDSSLHFILLRATANDGREEDMAVDTHKVKDGDKIVFSFKSTSAPARTSP